MESKFIVTTVYNATDEITTAAKRWAEELNSVFVRREKQSINSLMRIFNTDIILLSSREGPLICTPGGKYFFHLSMAELRIKNLVNGKHDHMTDAMGLIPGISVLDCTLGLASDAIVASYVAGPSGKITGVEHSPLLSLVAEEGLRNFTAADNDLTSALRRIEVIHADYNDYLVSLPDNSFDIVFFDPMFRVPVESSSNLKPLRYLADPRPLKLDALNQALRVASKRVIIKEKQNSSIFRELGITHFSGGKYSSVQYGILEVEN